MRTTALAPWVIACTAVCSSALVSQHSYGYGVEADWTLPGSGPFKSVAVGSFTANIVPSVAIDRGGVLYYVHKPCTYRSMVPVDLPVGAGPVTGLVAFERQAPSSGGGQAAPGPGSNPGPVPGPGLLAIEPDVLLVTTTSGAWLGEYDSTARQFAFVPVLNPDWHGATLLVAIKKGTSILLAGCSPDNQLLIGARNSFGGLTHLRKVQVETSLPIEEVKWLKWDADQYRDAVVTSQEGVFAFREDGTPLTGALFNLASMRSVRSVRSGIEEMTSVVEGLSWPTRLIWGTYAGTGSLELPTFGLSIEARAPVWLATQDVDSDGIPEFLYSRRDSYGLVFIDSATSISEITLVPNVLGDPTQNRGPFVWRDLSGDGIADGLFLWTSPPLMIYARNLISASPPPIEPVQAPPEHAIQGAHYSTDPPHLDLELNRNVGSGATHVDIVVWHQRNPFPPANHLVDPTSTMSIRVPIPTSGDTFPVQLNLAPTQVSVDGYWPNRDHYYLDISYVSLSLGKVLYNETDGLTMLTQHPPETGYELDLETTYSYLKSLQPQQGTTSSWIGIGYGEHATSSQSGLQAWLLALLPAPSQPGTEYAHTDLGGIRIRVRPPAFSATDDAIPQ